MYITHTTDYEITFSRINILFFYPHCFKGMLSLSEGKPLQLYVVCPHTGTVVLLGIRRPGTNRCSHFVPCTVASPKTTTTILCSTKRGLSTTTAGRGKLGLHEDVRVPPFRHGLDTYRKSVLKTKSHPGGSSFRPIRTMLTNKVPTPCRSSPLNSGNTDSGSHSRASSLPPPTPPLYGSQLAVSSRGKTSALFFPLRQGSNCVYPRHYALAEDDFFFWQMHIHSQYVGI